MSVHFNLGSHDGRMLDRLTETVKVAEQRSCEGYDWHFDAQGQDAITCGFEAIAVVTACCGELCQRCFDKPADHTHEVIKRFETRQESTVSHD